MNFNWVYKVLLTAVITTIVLLLFDAFGIMKPIKESTQGVDEIFYVRWYFYEEI